MSSHGAWYYDSGPVPGKWTETKQTINKSHLSISVLTYLEGIDSKVPSGNMIKFKRVWDNPLYLVLEERWIWEDLRSINFGGWGGVDLR